MERDGIPMTRTIYYICERRSGNECKWQPIVGPGYLTRGKAERALAGLMAGEVVRHHPPAGRRRSRRYLARLTVMASDEMGAIA